MKAQPGQSSGLLLVDKPAGMTSHTVVAQVRKRLLRAFPRWNPRNQPPNSLQKAKGASRPPRFKVGHAGTLDPLATGLLLILVGKGSRLSPFLMGLNKTYLATVRFGQATDTLDSDGQISATVPVPEDPAVIADQLDLFRGDIQQVPPAVSALKFQGQPLYKLVRQGRPLPELKARPVTISQLTITDTRWQDSELDLLVECSSGTYIRSLARDLAQAAGTEGHICGLRRLTVGPYDVKNAATGIMDLDGGALASGMYSLNQALHHLPFFEVDDDEAAAVRQGTQPAPGWLSRLPGLPDQGAQSRYVFRMVNGADDLVAVGCLDPETGAPRLVTVIPAEIQEDGVCG